MLLESTRLRARYGYHNRSESEVKQVPQQLCSAKLSTMEQGGRLLLGLGIKSGLSSKGAAQGSYIQLEAQPCTYVGNLATTKRGREHKVREGEA
jgi:hypothetical protein